MMWRFLNEAGHIYDDVCYSEPFVNIIYLDSWHIKDLSIFRTQDIQDESLK